MNIKSESRTSSNWSIVYAIDVAVSDISIFIVVLTEVYTKFFCNVVAVQSNNYINEEKLSREQNSNKERI